MSSSSVSFRITRNTEDLAEAIHALSQRLVRMEQRLVEMERVHARGEEADPEELTSLDNVERLLRDCRDLLEEEGPFPGAHPNPERGTAELETTHELENTQAEASKGSRSELAGTFPGEDDPSEADAYIEAA